MIRNIYILLLLSLLTPSWGHDPPELFQYNASTQQAFYWIDEVIVNEAPVDSGEPFIDTGNWGTAGVWDAEEVYTDSNQNGNYDLGEEYDDENNNGIWDDEEVYTDLNENGTYDGGDWVAAFKGNICVGSRHWDTSNCPNGLCDVPMMGDDGSEHTDGYMWPGDIPTFKIYDASEDIYYDVGIAKKNPAWSNSGFSYIDNIESCGVWDGSEECADDDSLVAPFTCASAVASFGCDFLWGGITIGEACPETCGLCSDVKGCMDMDACNYNSDATVDDCSCFESDCAGECGGSAEEDECGICFGDNTSCADCAGVPNGSAEYDNCGTCDADSSNDCWQDCAGEWGGSLVEDECGVCDGDGMQNYYMDTDFDGVGGDCDGNTFYFCFGEQPEWAVLECGDCDPNDENEIIGDECGVCGGDGIPEGECDCDGNVEDECGVCNGQGSIYECGCYEIAGGDCDCFGNVEDCAGECGGSSVVNECGMCLDEDSEECCEIYMDCAGICYGDAFLDVCGVCGGDGYIEHCFDNDGDGWGNNQIAYSTCDLPDDEWVLDCTDIDDTVYCESNELDACDICDGDNTSCSGCTDPEASNYNPDATVDDGSCFYCDSGDVNCDGTLNVLDIVIAANMILADEYDEIADMNEDGELNILDLVIMVNLVLFGEPSLCDGLTEVELWGVTYDIETTTEIELLSQGLTDSIPPEIGCLTNLISLSLGDNQLTGEIPVEIGNLTNLTSLYLNENNLTGEIPFEIESLTNLTFLRLSNNQLTGEIPSEIGNLTNLTELRLHNNQLSGSIPPEIGNLTNLTYLLMLSNQLSGEIPQAVCDLIENNTWYSEWNIEDHILAGNNLINTCE